MGALPVIDLPLIRPNPPRLSRLKAELEEIEASGIYSNGGPQALQFEAALLAAHFGGQGDCLAVANATLGLMMAIRHYAGPRRGPERFALMPSFTFAATGHAALWAGLTPLLCDVDPETFLPSVADEERLLAEYGDRIAVIVPYATFGNNLDLDRYGELSRRTGVAVVVDAAASLGSLDAQGRGFGTGARFAVVYSMHATKTFATGEGGVIYSADTDLIDRMRQMTNFGFAGARSAEMPGINAKLSEIGSLSARSKLAELEGVAAHREELAERYRAGLDEFALQRTIGRRQSMQFMSMLLPRELASQRADIIASLAARSIGAGCYFSPHLAQQPYFAEECSFGALPVSDDIGGRIVSLPITDDMDIFDVDRVCMAIKAICHPLMHVQEGKGQLASIAPRQISNKQDVAVDHIFGTVVVGGGPGGTALLLAASKRRQLESLADDGLLIIERDKALGMGRLGHYAITSDSTAETFLTCVKDNPYPELAALIDHPASQAVAAHIDDLGVPLDKAGLFLEVVGTRLKALIERLGIVVRTETEAGDAQHLANGLWRVAVRNLQTGEERHVLARNLVIATGGHQPKARLADERIDGIAVAERCAGRLIQSDEVLENGGVARVRAALAGVADPRIVILGGSTSAVSAANLLLKAKPNLLCAPGAITLMHRRPLRVFYPSVAAAHAEGYTDFGVEDICPLSGFVYRLAGFRLESRELIRRILGLSDVAADDRLALHRIDLAQHAETEKLLDDATLVIAALGYRPYALGLQDAGGTPIALAAQAPGRPPLVDDVCRVLAADGRPLDNLFAIGLAAGFVPRGKLGGEASFVGQANGLWLWQNDVGQLIIDQIIDSVRAAKAA